MLILLYIFLGFLIFDCLIAFRLYFLKKSSFKKAEEQLNYLKTVKSTQYGKTAKGDRRLRVFSPIISAFYFRLK
jgi:hypothetical protein